jgi:hypothetical protein
MVLEGVVLENSSGRVWEAPLMLCDLLVRND